MKTMTVTQARNQLLRVAEEMERSPDEIVEVVKRGKKVMTLVSSEVYDALIETLEIVADEATLSKLRRALQEIEKGKGMSWSEAKKKLRLLQ